MIFLKIWEIDVNIFCTLLLSILIFLEVLLKKKNNIILHKTFLSIIITMLLFTIVDAINLFVNGNSTEFLILINNVSVFLYFLFMPLPIMFSAVAIDYALNNDVNRIKYVMIILFIPFFINIVLDFLSPIQGFYFYISTTNIYIRSYGFYFSIFLILVPVIYILFQIIKHRKELDTVFFTFVLISLIFPVVGNFIQIFFPKLHVIIPTMTLSIFILFLMIRINFCKINFTTMFKDEIYFHEFIKNLNIEKKQEELMFVFFDINEFKKFKENYGEKQAEQILKVVATTIKYSFKHSDEYIIFDTDRFLIVSKNINIKNTKESIVKFFSKIKIFNSNSKEPYTISIESYYDIYKTGIGLNFYKVIEELSDNMKIKKNKNIQGEKNVH